MYAAACYLSDDDDYGDGNNYDDHRHNLYIIGRFCVCVCHEKVTKFFFFLQIFFF